jgi:ribosomal protein L27
LRTAAKSTPQYSPQGTDHTIFSKVDGFVKFHTDKKTKRRTISVINLPQQQVELKLAEL